MSTPNPLIPQGTFQAQAAKGASNIRIAVATIVAIHIVFFGGLLLQGCKRDTQTLATNTETNFVETNTSLALPPLDTNSLYYTSESGLPGGETGYARTPLPDTNPPLVTPQPRVQNPESLWRATNLASPVGSGTVQQPGTAQFSAGTKEYTVVARDTLSGIAKAHGTTVSAIRAANPEVEPTRIRPGDKLLIPQGGAASSQGGSDAAPAARSNGLTTYTVKAGDTLTRIANAHGVSISQLRAANNLKTSRINVGQTLKIPPGNQRSATNAGNQNSL